jgi:hypothetical protein
MFIHGCVLTGGRPDVGVKSTRSVWRSGAYVTNIRLFRNTVERLCPEWSPWQDAKDGKVQAWWGIR